MTQVTIIHNPRCSKSRQTLVLLEEKGITPNVIEYLKTPLSLEEVTSVFKKLNVESVRHMMRTNEVEYKEAKLMAADVNEHTLLQAMVTTPKLIERPIVINENHARIGRPPENVLEII